MSVPDPPEYRNLEPLALTNFLPPHNGAPSAGHAGRGGEGAAGGSPQQADRFRRLAVSAHCCLWEAVIEERGEEKLDWSVRMSDEAAAQQFFPVELQPGQPYMQALYRSRLEEDRLASDWYGNAQVRAGRSYSQVFRCRRPDGEIRWLREEVEVEVTGPNRWHAVGVCVDITVQKQAEEALRRREARLRRQSLAMQQLAAANLPGRESTADALQHLVQVAGATLDAAQASLWLYEPLGGSPSCTSWMRARDSAGPSSAAVPPEGGAAAAPEQSARPLNLGRLCGPDAPRVLEMPVRIEGRAVGVLWIEGDDAEPTWEPDVQSFASAAADLASLVLQAAENRRMRRELEERNRRFDQLLDNAQCLLWEARVTERDGLFDWSMRMSDEAAAQRFLPLEVADGETYSEAWYWSKRPEDHARMLENSNRAIRAGDSGYQQEFSCRQEDGRVRWLWEDVRIRATAPGEWRLVGVCTDITARKRAEQRDAAFLRLGEQLNQAASPEQAARILLEVADDLLGWDACWLALQDRDDASMRFTVVMDEIDGRRTEVNPPPSVLGISPLARRALQEGAFLHHRPARVDHPQALRFGDLTRTTRCVLVVPIRHRSRELGVLSLQSYTPDAYTQEDLRTLEALADYCAGALERTRVEAARARLEEELHQAQKMEAIGRLAGGVAHDFNNMLMVINGYAALLAANLPAGTPSGLAVREIAAAGDRAAALTRQLLAFSRKQMLTPQVFPVCDLLAELQSMIRPLIGEDTELRVDCTTVDGRIEADRHQLEHALVNLVVNARDAMPEGGRLLLTARDVEKPSPGEEAAGAFRAWIELAVRDTGVGMSPQVQERIFEPFFSTKEAGKGTGLGLSTVFGIVRQSGGFLEVESALGEGATFRIYLPRVEAIS